MRIARVHVPGVVHHLVWRFVDRNWYFQDDEERSRYLWLLGRALEKSDWLCVAYALMSNHIHLALFAGKHSLASWSRRVNSPFAFWMNERHGRLGPIFADRPRDHALGVISQSTVVGYIHNNPVRARIISSARDSEWTSHRAYIGLAPVPRWLHVSRGMELCGATDAADFERYTNGWPELPELPDVGRVRKAAARHGALDVGTPCDNSVSIVARELARIRPAPLAIIETIATEFDVPPALVASRKRAESLSNIRTLIARTAAAAGITSTTMGTALGISGKGVRYLEQRECDDADLERAMNAVIDRGCLHGPRREVVVGRLDNELP
ncbi:MAG: transposase [Kofleriaceae bacterium]